MFDVVFRNAEIIDGTGGPARCADVAVQNGRIIRVGPVDERGRVEYDCDGLVLAPGFIDVHTHSDGQLFADPSRLCKLRQGVTTEIGGNCGSGLGPIADPVNPVYARFAGIVSGSRFATTYARMLSDQAEQRPGCHQLTFVGHRPLRGSVMGMDDREATAEELEKMKALLDEAMRQGAPGFSTGLVYAPSCYGRTQEIIELCKVVAKYDGIYTTHMRNEADGLLDSVAETVRIAREAGVQTQISHLKVMYQKNRHLLPKALELIEQANAEGCRITFDVYPYDACSANYLSTLPPSYLSHGIDWLVKEVSTPEGTARLEKAIKEPTEVWENPLLNAGFDKDLLCITAETPDAQGKTYHDYAVEHGMTDVEAYAYIISKNGANGQDIRFLMSEDDLAMLYKHPLCMVGTDGLYTGTQTCTHPRGLATFPRYLARFIREQKVLSMEEGVRRLTGLAADTFHLSGKGYIKEGYDADMVLFNKNTIRDHATYTNPLLPNEGIKAVFVLGQAAVVDNLATGVYNGTILKRNGQR